MPDETTAALSPAHDGLYRLDLAGAFTHPHWLAFLCGGLSSAGVSVVSGSARRDSPLQWTSHFLLDAGKARTPLDLLDPVAMAGQRLAVRDASVPVLTSFTAIRRPDRQIEVQVSAPDALGFLGRLLSRISLLTLLPSELEIHTIGSTVQDRLVLGGIGSAPPGDEVLVSLNDLLRGLAVAA